MQIGLGLGGGQALPRWWPEGAVYAVDFVAGRHMKNGISVSAAEAYTFSRASGKYAADLAGQYHYFGPSIPAITDAGLSLEPASTELIRNTAFAGAVAGTVGSGGSMPHSGWSAPGSGLSTIVSIPPAENGLPCLDLRFVGIPTGNAFLLLEGRTQIAASVGETFTLAANCRMVAGSTSNINALGIALGESNAAGVDLSAASSTDFRSVVGDLQTRTVVRTMTQSETAYCQPYIRFGLTMGMGVDITLRLSVIRFAQGHGARSPVLTSGIALARAADQVQLLIGGGISTVLGRNAANSIQDFSYSESGTLSVASPVELARLFGF